MKRGLVYVASTIVVCALLVVLWREKHKRDIRQDSETRSTILKPEDSAKIIVDPRRHTIVTVTREGTTATFLPGSGASVTVGKSGGVRTNVRTWGTEVSPFVGGALGMDIKLRAATGLNLFYWYRWELGGGLLTGGIRDTRVYMQVSYNAYDNLFVALGADNRGTAHFIAGIKF